MILSQKDGCFIKRDVKCNTSVFPGLLLSMFLVILGDPGADSGDEEKSKRAEKYIWNKEK